MDKGIERTRLDKWLWSARLFKTRSLAAEAIGKGHVDVNGAAAKPARELRLNDRIDLRRAGEKRCLVVLGLQALRGPASLAQTMYEETAESLAARALAAEARRMGVEPAQGLEHGRPTKRDRREIDRAQWQRWSASIDGE